MNLNCNLSFVNIFLIHYRKKHGGVGAGVCTPPLSLPKTSIEILGGGIFNFHRVPILNSQKALINYKFESFDYHAISRYGSKLRFTILDRSAGKSAMCETLAVNRLSIENLICYFLS